MRDRYIPIDDDDRTLAALSDKWPNICSCMCGVVWFVCLQCTCVLCSLICAHERHTLRMIRLCVHIKVRRLNIYIHRSCAHNFHLTREEPEHFHSYESIWPFGYVATAFTCFATNTSWLSWRANWLA